MIFYSTALDKVRKLEKTRFVLNQQLAAVAVILMKRPRSVNDFRTFVGTLWKKINRNPILFQIYIESCFDSMDFNDTHGTQLCDTNTNKCVQFWNAVECCFSHLKSENQFEWHDFLTYCTQSKTQQKFLPNNNNNAEYKTENK